MLKETIFSAVLIFLMFPAFAQREDMYAEKYFVIIAATPDIKEAYSIAKAASQNTGLDFTDNKLQPDSTIGATFPAEVCAESEFEFPCYVARGRFDDGTYLSVEYSGGYSGLKKGLFLVIAANGDENNSQMEDTLKKMKAFYPTSYTWKTKVYMGCMH
jgi:hypothetical protein